MIEKYTYVHHLPMYDLYGTRCESCALAVRVDMVDRMVCIQKALLDQDCIQKTFGLVLNEPSGVELGTTGYIGLLASDNPYIAHFLGRVAIKNVIHAAEDVGSWYQSDMHEVTTTFNAITRAFGQVLWSKQLETVNGHHWFVDDNWVWVNTRLTAQQELDLAADIQHVLKQFCGTTLRVRVTHNLAVGLRIQLSNDKLKVKPKFNPNPIFECDSDQDYTKLGDVFRFNEEGIYGINGGYVIYGLSLQLSDQLYQEALSVNVNMDTLITNKLKQPSLEQKTKSTP